MYFLSSNWGISPFAIPPYCHDLSLSYECALAFATLHQTNFLTLHLLLWFSSLLHFHSFLLLVLQLNSQFSFSLFHSVFRDWFYIHYIKPWPCPNPWWRHPRAALCASIFYWHLGHVPTLSLLFSPCRLIRLWGHISCIGHAGKQDLAEFRLWHVKIQQPPITFLTVP